MTLYLGLDPLQPHLHSGCGRSTPVEPQHECAAQIPHLKLSMPLAILLQLQRSVETPDTFYTATLRARNMHFDSACRRREQPGRGFVGEDAATRAVWVQGHARPPRLVQNLDSHQLVIWLPGVSRVSEYPSFHRNVSWIIQQLFE